ncbi:MAG: dihydrofolate reductase, partial [Lachnospiraceae bacterium]|nr:dihydrofolate reductase [Lachnospiraceae bacterium]
SIYKMFFDKCDTLYITKVYKTFDADTFFPDYENMGYEVVEKNDMMNFDGIDYQFITYSKGKG